MSTVTCPRCGHPFSTSHDEATEYRPDVTVSRWFRDLGGSLAGDVHVSEAYESYLRAGAEPPVSRQRLVADLAHFGIESDDEGNLAFY